MLQIQQVSSNALQSQTLILPDGSEIALTVYFSPIQFGWFINSLVYGSLTIKGLRITNSPNMLHQWQNLIPFGLACFSVNNREPSQQNDFLSGASSLFILTQAEVLEYAAYLAGGSV